MLSERKEILPAFLACFLFFVSPVTACDIPVFRYALQRWSADEYRLVVFHRGEPSRPETLVVEYLRKQAGQGANLGVHVVDLAGQVDKPVADLWSAEKTQKLPRMVLLYPANKRTTRKVWSGPLTMSNARAIVESPLRKKIADLLKSGQAGVWIMIDGGSREKDAAALKKLTGQLARMSKELSDSKKIPIAFTLLRLSRDDSFEAILRAMLLRSEADLETQYSSQPMVFPIFGRGRILYALVGKGITTDNISEACRFIVGPCACEIKADNPGADMLIKTDWEVSDEEWVELPAPISPRQEESKPTANDANTDTKPHSLYNINILIGLGVMVVVIGILVFFMNKRSSSK